MKKAFYARRAWHAFFNLFLALMWTLGETMDSVRWIHGLNTQAPWCLSLFWCLVSVSSAQGSQGNGQLLCECWTVKSPVRSLWLHVWIEKLWFDIWYLCAIFVILDVHTHSHPAASRVYWASHWCMQCVMSSDSSDDFTSQNGKLYSVRTLASKPRSFVRDFVTNHYQLNDDFGGFLRGRRWLEWIPPVAWYHGPNHPLDHSISLFNHSLSLHCMTFTREAHRQTSLRFAVVHWRIRRKWSDGSENCFGPWVARQGLAPVCMALPSKGVENATATVTLVLFGSFWWLLCVVCCVLFVVFCLFCVFFFMCSFYFLLFFFSSSVFSVFSSSVFSFFLLHFYICLLLFFLSCCSCCCCCCYGWWWHIHLLVMLTVVVLTCFDLQRSMDKKAKTDKHLGLTHGHCCLSHWWLGCAGCGNLAALRYFLGSAFFQFQTAYSSLVFWTDQIASYLRVESHKCLFVQLDGTGYRITQNSWILN